MDPEGILIRFACQHDEQFAQEIAEETKEPGPSLNLQSKQLTPVAYTSTLIAR